MAVKDPRFTEYGDRNFDDLADKFEARIYGGYKGRNRLEILRRDLAQVLDNNSKPLRILDVGAGSAQFTQELVQAGHRITICDVSQNMLDFARERMKPAIESGQVTLIHASLQDLPEKISERFDLVMFHAVLEWLAEPVSGLEILPSLLSPDGAVSVLFYNRPSLVFYHLTHANFVTARGNRVRGHKKSLTPINPIEPAEITDWFDAHEYELICASGIRVFSDFIHRDALPRVEEEELIASELQFSQQEPYRSMARYLHYLYRPQDG